MENSKTIHAVNDLLKINNDRLKGFQEVDKEMISNYAKLSADYDHMVMQATKMRNELITIVNEYGGKAEDSATVAGGFHRTWIDVKNAFVSDKDTSTLESVLFGEKAAIKAYEDALDSDDISPEIRVTISNQLQDLHASYAKFKSFEKDKDLE